MATRRIARGRGPSPVPIIVLVVLVVGLLGSTIVLALKVGDLQTNIEDGLRSVQATANFTEEQIPVLARQPLRNALGVIVAAVRKKELERLQKFQTIVGLNPDAAEEEYVLLKKDLEKRGPLPDVGQETFTDIRTLLLSYADRSAALERVVKRLEGKLEGAKAALEQAKRDAEAEAKTKDEQIASLKETIAQLRSAKADLEAKLDKTSKELAAQVEALKAQRIQTAKKLSALNKEIENLRETIKQKDEMIAELRFPKKVTGSLITAREAEPPDGKVLSVDPDGQFLMVDVGRRDWLAVGMVFQVYDNADPEARKPKGEIQIRKVYEDIARAKVLKQDEVDPILPGMIIVNPAFKRGAKLEFVFKGGFAHPLPYIKRLLAFYRCSFAPKVTRTTDYLIIGESPSEEEGAIPPEESEDYRLALQYKIPIMKESDLLRYLGELE